MSGKNIIFDDKKINKSNFYKNKKLFNIYDIDVDKTLISNEKPYGTIARSNIFLDIMMMMVSLELYICIKLLQMIGYVKHFESNRTMSFKVNDNRLLKKYTKIWGRVDILMNTIFDSELVYGDNDKYIKAKIKSYGDKANTNFQGKKIPNQNASYKCLLIFFTFSCFT